MIDTYRRHVPRRPTVANHRCVVHTPCGFRVCRHGRAGGPEADEAIGCAKRAGRFKTRVRGVFSARSSASA